MKRVLSLFFLGLILLSAPAFAEEVSKMSREELKAKIDKGEEIIILDMRSPGSYDGSKIKIKGALRVSPNQFDEKLKDVSPEREIVTYCT